MSCGTNNLKWNTWYSYNISWQWTDSISLLIMPWFILVGGGTLLLIDIMLCTDYSCKVVPFEQIKMLKRGELKQVQMLQWRKEIWANWNGMRGGGGLNFKMVSHAAILLYRNMGCGGAEHLNFSKRELKLIYFRGSKYNGAMWYNIHPPHECEYPPSPIYHFNDRLETITWSNFILIFVW